MSRTWTLGEPPTDLAAMLEAVGALMGEEFAEALDRAIALSFVEETRMWV